MITEAQIAEILSLYKKHGWTLSRVLLSAELEKNLSEKAIKLFGPAGHLTTAPFALFEVFGADADEDFRREKLLEMENRLIEKFSKNE
jgi:hypothetical protein